MKDQLKLLEKLFDAKLEPFHIQNSQMADDITSIKKALYGNGKPGICGRLDCVENTQKNMLGKIGMVSAFFGLVIAGMFEIITKFFSKKIGL
jgi:hypothetical protein